MENNMNEYKARLNKEYQDRFQKLKESIQNNGGTVGNLPMTMEDPEEIEKRENERKANMVTIQRLTE